MSINYIYKICVTCNADGTHPDSIEDENGNPTPSGTKVCDKCQGLGKYLWGYLQDELEGEE